MKGPSSRAVARLDDHLANPRRGPLTHGMQCLLQLCGYPLQRRLDADRQRQERQWMRRRGYAFYLDPELLERYQHAASARRVNRALYLVDRDRLRRELAEYPASTEAPGS